MKNRLRLCAVAALTVLGAGGAVAADKPSWGEGANDAAFGAMLKSGFRARGIAGLSRLDQDATQAFCSDPERANSTEAAGAKARIEAENMATIKWPADGKWLGDWKAGEKLAQSGRGLTWSDKADVPNGANCYNCHQLSSKEIAFGTIGPSLHHYAKVNGADDKALRYAWGHIYNANAYNACSTMPRGGYKGILTEQQMQDLMALLFDPESPVNKD